MVGAFIDGQHALQPVLGYVELDQHPALRRQGPEIPRRRWEAVVWYLRRLTLRVPAPARLAGRPGGYVLATEVAAVLTQLGFTAAPLMSAVIHARYLPSCSDHSPMKSGETAAHQAAALLCAPLVGLRLYHVPGGVAGRMSKCRQEIDSEMKLGSSRKRRAVSEIALFCSGMFAGGAIDHSILALKRKQHTPYGIRASAAGNWIFAAFDAAVACAAFALHRRLFRVDQRPPSARPR